MSINKEWIKENNFESDAYRKGVLEFLEFVLEHMSGDKHSCPCRRCRNGTGHIHVGEIFVHLMEYGMVQDYNLWHFHGEGPRINQVHERPQSGTVIDIIEPIDKSNFPRLDELVNDACEMFTREADLSTPNCERSNRGHAAAEVPDDPQTHKGKKYERLHRLAMEPLHPSTGESRHTTMYALVKLNDLKTQFSLSDGATGAVLGLLNELLPEGNNLTTSYSEAKNTIRYYSSRLGYLTRTHIPICYKSWKAVPALSKTQLWTAYKGEFPDVKDSQRVMFMKKANNAWKKFKVKLRAKLVGDDVTKWKELVPVNTRSEDWERFCDHEATESQKDVRKRNKAIKVSCPTKTTHNTGRDGYARRAEKWKAEHGRYPNRAELWLYTHKLKDGCYAPHDKEFADKVEMLLKLFQESGEEESLDSGPIFDTFGKETRGGVRCVGSIISKKAMMASAFAREMLQEVSTDHDDWRGKVDSLKEEMEALKSTVIDFVKDFKSGKFMFGSHDIHTTHTTSVATPTSVTPTSTPQFSSADELVPCKILSYLGELCAYGRKTQLNAVPLVHGHRLKPREVRVILDKIIMHDCLLWGGKQSSCSTLGDVGVGGFLFWHDDLLPPHDDIDQE